MDKEKLAQLKELLQNKQLENLAKKIDDMIEIMKKRPEPHFITQMPPEVRMTNFEKAPDQVKIANFPDEVKIANFPDEVKIANFPDEVKILNFPEQKEIQKVEIINHKAEKDHTPFLTKLIKATENIGDVFRGLWESGIALKQNTKKTPIYVVHVDEKGAPIGRQEFQVFGGGGSSSVQIPTQIKTGNVAVAVAGTPIALGAATSKTKKVTITASFNNTGYVWVGDSSVSASGEVGIPLLQGATYELEINNLASIFIDADNAGDKVSFVALS